LAAPGFASLQLHRRLAWGQLAQLHLLDGRQYRDRQACRRAQASGAGAVRRDDCEELAETTRSFLGSAQERWLDDGLAEDARQSSHWSAIAQQTLLSPRHYPSGVQSTDTWDGYPAARARLTRSMARHVPGSAVVLGGDIHQNYVCRVPEDALRPDGKAVASEFCGTSISSRSGTTQTKLDAIVRHNPHVLLARCEERGYGLADITPQLWTTRLQALDDPLRADSGVRTLARFVVERGRPGPVRET
jgi:alkaline phosphatase D